jgi:hypothetical protein
MTWVGEIMTGFGRSGWQARRFPLIALMLSCSWFLLRHTAHCPLTHCLPPSYSTLFSHPSFFSISTSTLTSFLTLTAYLPILIRHCRSQVQSSAFRVEKRITIWLNCRYRVKIQTVELFNFRTLAPLNPELWTLHPDSHHAAFRTRPLATPILLSYRISVR